MPPKPSDKKVESKDAKPAEPTQDEIFTYNEEAIKKLNVDKPWASNSRYFGKVKISALCAMKMLKHSLAGVKKGREGEGGTPIEIMGLLVGKPDGDSIVVMDAEPLPVEGIEYKVEASDEAQGYMLQLMEALEARGRKERFIGWYHSHPFDVDVNPMYFLSAMDVGTQTLWQNSIPAWTAIVLDPLRSLAKQEPQLGCFRVYPATYNPPKLEGPDGNIYPDEATLSTRWGAAANRYYQLQHSYFMSSLGHNLLDTMSRNNLWVRVLSSSTIMEPENRLRFSERVKKAADKLQVTASQPTGRYPQFGSRRGATKEATSADRSQACTELAIEQCAGHASQISKNLLFNYIRIAQKRDEAKREL
jgi:COP9 signalosome complex subunit 5